MSSRSTSRLAPTEVIEFLNNSGNRNSDITLPSEYLGSILAGGRGNTNNNATSQGRRRSPVTQWINEPPPAARRTNSTPRRTSSSSAKNNNNNNRNGLSTSNANSNRHGGGMMRGFLNNNASSSLRRGPTLQPFTNNNNGNARGPVIRLNNAGRFVLNNNDMPGDLIGVETPPALECVTAARQHGIKSQAFQESFRRHVRRLLPSGSVCGRDKLSASQVRVYELAKVMAAADGKDRGQLVWANTGGGKTVIALAIALAYWDSGRRIFVVTTPDNRSSNDVNKYADYMEKYFKQASQAIKQEHSVETVARLFSATNLNAKVVFISFEMLAHALGYTDSGAPHSFRRYRKAFGTDPNNTRGNNNNGKSVKKLWDLNHGEGSVIIFDEAHQLLRDSKDPKYTALVKVMEKLEGLNVERHQRGLHIWGLTATPSDTVGGWLKILNIMRPVGAPSFGSTADAHALTTSITDENSGRVEGFFRAHLDGLVSYNEARGNLSDHACVYSKSYPVEMDRWYYAAYLNGLALKEATAAQKMRLGMFLLEKEYKNIIPSKVIKIAHNARKLLGKKWVSNKFILLARTLATTPGKHFVYTRYALKELKEALQTWYGMQDVTDAAIKSGGKCTWERNFKNFVVLPGASVSIKEFSKKTAVFHAINGTDDRNDVPTRNLQGDEVKIVLAGGHAYEGTDLKGLRHVHVTEVMGTPLEERQLVGRGVRFCGHAFLPAKDRNVTVVRWYTMPPRASTRDQVIKSLVRGHIGKKTMGKRLQDGLARVERGIRTYGSTGYEYREREKRMRDQKYVILSTFETLLAKRASGKTASFAPLSKFTIIPGKACRE